MRQPNGDPTPSFEDFEVVNLFCPTCRAALPVKKRLLLVLPDGGEIYEYRCTKCNTFVGKKRDQG
jgi:hypothetical protein